MATSSPLQNVSPTSAANGRDAGLFLHIPRTAFSHAGFRAWVKSDEFPEKLRVTYVDGEIYLDMSKESLETHVKVKGEVSRVLLNLNRELDLGEFYLDGALISNEEAGVSNNPDAVFCSWEAFDSGQVRLVPGKKERDYVEIEGTPDWVLEVLSDSSVAKDTRKLRAAYHRAGIREYWLIDARGAEIEFHIFHWRKAGYAAAPRRQGWQRSNVFGRGCRLIRERARPGLWQYSLLYV